MAGKVLFVKGDPRINRRGRPSRGTALADIVRELSEIKDIRLDDGTVVERKRALAHRIWMEAIKGNPAMAALVWKMLDEPDRKGGGDDPNANNTIVVIEKRSVEEWVKSYAKEVEEGGPLYGSLSLGKPKPLHVQRLKSFLEGPKEAERAITSLEITPQVYPTGEGPGEEFYLEDRTKS